LCDSSAYEFYVPTFRYSICSIFIAVILCADVSEHCICSIFVGHVFAPSMKMELTKCSETSAHKIQTAGNHPNARIQHLQHVDILISINCIFLFCANFLTDLDQIRYLRCPKSSRKVYECCGNSSSDSRTVPQYIFVRIFHFFSCPHWVQLSTNAPHVMLLIMRRR